MIPLIVLNEDWVSYYDDLGTFMNYTNLQHILSSFWYIAHFQSMSDLILAIDPSNYLII